MTGYCCWNETHRLGRQRSDFSKPKGRHRRRASCGRRRPVGCRIGWGNRRRWDGRGLNRRGRAGRGLNRRRLDGCGLDGRRRGDSQLDGRGLDGRRRGGRGLNRRRSGSRPGTHLPPTLQSLIDAAPSGSTLQLPNCIFREQATITKPAAVVGPAEIRGSELWTGFTAVGATWVSTATQPSIYSHGNCNPTVDAQNTCLLLEQVFLDGVELTQLADGATPGPGQFAMDSGRHLVLGTDPTGKAVEVSKRQYWLLVESDDVTVDHVTFRYAASDSQRGAFSVRQCCAATPVYHRVTLKNSRLLHAAGAVVGMGNDNVDVRLENNEIVWGEQLGVGGCGTNGYLGYNHIHHNNFALLWDSGWEGGGHKFGFSAAATGCTIEYNEFDNNGGPGTWADTGGNQTTWRFNRVHDNSGNGIMMETSSTSAR